MPLLLQAIFDLQLYLNRFENIKSVGGTDVVFFAIFLSLPSQSISVSRMDDDGKGGYTVLSETKQKKNVSTLA